MIKMIGAKHEEKPEEPEYDMPLFHTHFHKEHEFAVKHFGGKVVKAEEPHRHVIGKNSSICKKLFGVGHILNDLPGFRFNFRNVDNHCWIPQPNLKDNNKIMDICINCGSLLINNKFIPYTDLK